MRIETLKIKNFKVFKDVEVKKIPNMAVFLGMNGVGKSTFFDIFGFLNDCLTQNVKTALAARHGFKEVISRDQEGDIEFLIQFRPAPREPLVTYELSIGLDSNEQPVVTKETMRFRRGQNGKPFIVLDFSYGKGYAVSGKINSLEDVQNTNRTDQSLNSPDILAIKGLGQFQDFVAVSAFRKLVEDWHVSDFHIDEAKQRNPAGYSESLSKTGDNLANVAKYMFETHKSLFDAILKKMKERVPGVTNVEAEDTKDGYVVLRFNDGKFKDPFSSRLVSDGTIKMFAYLVMLNSPSKRSLLCVEEPENQLYPQLLQVLAEEFRAYSDAGGQVFISTHSPDFLNAVNLNEVIVFKKKNGYTYAEKLSKNDEIKKLVSYGDKLGWLWKQGFFDEVGSEK